MEYQINLNKDDFKLLMAQAEKNGVSVLEMVSGTKEKDSEYHDEFEVFFGD